MHAIEMGNTKSTLVHKDGESKYCGEVIYKKDKWYAEGKGCYEAPGYMYTGTFKQNQMSGTGACTYANGIFYSGSWKSGFKHGKGKLMFPDGDSYEGDFRFDIIHGKGKYAYVNGTYYTGNFCNNEMTGQGKLYSGADTLLYSGEWLHDVFHGYGTYYYPNGKISYQGRWKNSKADGPGMFQDTTGRIWCGHFKLGEYIGKDAPSSDGITVVLPTESVPLRKSSDTIPRNTVVVYEEDIPSPKTSDLSEKISFRPCGIRQKNIAIVNPIHNIIVPTTTNTKKNTVIIKNPLTAALSSK
jgi:hypothetical protein